MVLASFRTFRPRHPLARLLVGVLGAIAVLALVALSLFAVAAIAIGSGLFLLINSLRSTPRPTTASGTARGTPAKPGVIEGEYTVVQADSAREPAR